MHRRMFTASPQTTICHPQFPIPHPQLKKNEKHENMKILKGIMLGNVFVHENDITFEAVHSLLAVGGLHASPAMLSQQAEQQRQVQQSKESVPKFHNVCEMQHCIKCQKISDCCLIRS